MSAPREVTVASLLTKARGEQLVKGLRRMLRSDEEIRVVSTEYKADRDVRRLDGQSGAMVTRGAVTGRIEFFLGFARVTIEDAS